VKPYSVAYRQKMIERLIGADPISANALAKETGIRQQTLSRWLEEARSLRGMTDRRRSKTWSLDTKVRILAETSKLTGDELVAYLRKEGVLLAELEQWRLALEEEGRASVSTSRRIRQLERELARKEKALAEAAALLVLKKKLEHLEEDEDDDTDEENEK
jgi:phage antirepressor YoqD-like protein